MSEWGRLMTASKVAAVLGLSPWTSQFSLWHEMAGVLPVEPTSDVQARGQYLEAGVVAWFRDQHPDWTITHVTEMPHAADKIVTLPDGREHPIWFDPTEPRFAASPDGVWSCGREHGLLEVKTANDGGEWGLPGTDEIPPYYYAQVQWQMMVTKAPETRVAVLLPYLEFREYRVYADATFIEGMREAAHDFLDMLPGGPRERVPDWDGAYNTYVTVRKLHPEIEDREVVLEPWDAVPYIEAQHRLRQAKDEAQRQTTRMALLMRTAHRASYQGRVLVRRQARGVEPPYLVTAKSLPRP